MRRLARDGSGRAELQLLLRMSLGLVGVRGGRSGRSPGRAGRRGAAAGSARPRAGPRTSRGCRRRSAAAPPEGEGLSRGVVADRSAFPSLRLLNWGAALEMSEGGTGLIPGTSRPVPSPGQRGPARRARGHRSSSRAALEKPPVPGAGSGAKPQSCAPLSGLLQKRLPACVGSESASDQFVRDS